MDNTINNDDDCYALLNEDFGANDYQMLYEASQSWPSCFEKSLIKCIWHAYLRNTDASSQAKFDVVVSNIDEECECMKNRLQIEELDSKNFERYIEILNKNFKNNNWTNILADSEVLLKKIRVLDIEKIKNLINKIHDTDSHIRNKDIILFLGPTGSGKSTTVHFLCGSKMERIKKFGLNHIEATENKKNPSIIQSIKSSPLMRSETKHIAVVEVQYVDAGLTKKGSIFLCDSPGFEDTNGPEVDIANAIGVIKAISNCGSVRPVILVSYPDYAQARMQGLQKLVHVLVDMLEDPIEHVSTFSFLFTNFPEGRKEDVMTQIELLTSEILNDSKTEDDSSFLAFFDELKNKLNLFGPRFVEPLSQDRKELFRLLAQSSPISRPKNAFKFSISQASRGAIKEQVLQHQKKINSSILKHDYKFVNYKLNEIKYLHELLKDKFIEQVYQECNAKIQNTINERYAKVKTIFQMQCAVEMF